MSDLPEQGVFQQRHANPISGEHLELFGKKASADWARGEYDDLNEAVVETIKHAGLSPEQVQRVIEFANTAAYLSEFKKEGSDHKVVDFPGGPADPSVIFKDLNDGGGGSVFDRGNNDYYQPPAEKKAAASEEFLNYRVSDQDYASADPLKDAHNVCQKLASARDHLQRELMGADNDLFEVSERLLFQVKQASLAGHSLGEVLQVLSVADPNPTQVKLAFSFMSPRLVKNGVFSSREKVAESLQKTGSAQVVNAAHPIVTEFKDFCESLDKIAQMSVALAEVEQQHDELNDFLQKAAAGAWGKVRDAAAKAGEKAAPHAKDLVHRLTGSQEAAGLAESITHKGLQYAPHAAIGVGLNEVRRNMKYSPTYNKIVGMTIPTSDAYAQREAEIAGQYGRYPE